MGLLLSLISLNIIYNLQSLISQILIIGEILFVLDNYMYYIFEDKCFDSNKNQLIGNITTEPISYSKLNLDNVAITNVDTILLFQNRWDDNFRHFMIETFHLLSCLFSNNVDKSNIKIMIYKNYCKNSYQI